MQYHIASGNLLQFAIENGPVEIVDLPSYKLVDLSSSFFVNVYQGLIP